MAKTSGAPADLDDLRARIFPFPQRHFLSAADLNAPQATALLDLADGFVSLSRQASKTIDLLKGMASEDERERVAVYMDGLSQMRSEWAVANRAPRPTAPAGRRK